MRGPLFRPQTTGNHLLCGSCPDCVTFERQGRRRATRSIEQLRFGGDEDAT
jgi:hypothetical protein